MSGYDFCKGGRPGTGAESKAQGALSGQSGQSSQQDKGQDGKEGQGDGEVPGLDETQVQQVLKASAGIDYAMFFHFLDFNARRQIEVLRSRLSRLSRLSSLQRWELAAASAVSPSPFPASTTPPGSVALSSISITGARPGPVGPAAPESPSSAMPSEPEALPLSGPVAPDGRAVPRADTAGESSDLLVCSSSLLAPFPLL